MKVAEGISETLVISYDNIQCHIGENIQLQANCLLILVRRTNGAKNIFLPSVGVILHEEYVG